ncbi:MAG: hypothetical protein M3247_03315 [Thermoproteota archaeon]|nr:hypothetical protein [Thermoproteota archaeon]
MKHRSNLRIIQLILEAAPDSTSSRRGVTTDVGATKQKIMYTAFLTYVQ